MKITITWRFIIGIDISKKVLDIYLYDQKTQKGSWLRVVTRSREDHGLEKSGF